jgi:hypothetical protein
VHCDDNEGDRARGTETEIEFAKLSKQLRFTVLKAHEAVKDALNLRCETMPNHSTFDMVVGRPAWQVMVEIKGKFPTRNIGPCACYGFEEYRLRDVEQALMFVKSAVYVIFDTEIKKWRCADFRELVNEHKLGKSHQWTGSSYRGGEERKELQFFWPTTNWSDDLSRWLDVYRVAAREAIRTKTVAEFVLDNERSLLAKE